MATEQSDYQSYLLRLYPAPSPRETVCRATLQSTQTGKRVGFATLREAFDFLERSAGAVSPNPCEGSVKPQACTPSQGSPRV
jgi:hypothetical protein